MLTQEQKDKLHKAIDAAEGPGKCRYVAWSVSEGKATRPLCVMAQLAVMEGVTLEQLRVWDNLQCNSIIDVIKESEPGSEKLAAYPREFLQDLQATWDGASSEFDAAFARRKMHDAVSVR